MASPWSIHRFGPIQDDRVKHDSRLISGYALSHLVQSNGWECVKIFQKTGNDLSFGQRQELVNILVPLASGRANGWSKSTP
jgi:hypothetical protein